MRARRRAQLDAELLGALGSRGLERERPEPLAHFLLDVARALDLRRDARELQLRAVPARLELAEPRRLLQEHAPLGRLRPEDLLDLALADDRVHAAAEPDVGQELDEVDAADRRPVDEVLALAAALKPPRDRDLGPFERPVADAVVEQELDLAMLRLLPRPGAREEDVVGLLRPQLTGRKRARSPDDRVGNVRLAGPVRPDDDGHAWLELNLDRLHERLEAAQLDRT